MPGRLLILLLFVAGTYRLPQAPCAITYVANAGVMFETDGRKFLQIAPNVSTFPCAAIFLVVLAFNVLGDALRDALDPKLRQ